MVALFCAASALAQDGSADPSTFDHRKDVSVLSGVLDAYFASGASNLSSDNSLR